MDGTVSADGGSEEEKRAPPPQAAAGEKGEVYVCGDSHTLTPAWHEVSVAGK